MEEAKKINTDNFQIENNFISFHDSILQISNISQVNIAPAPKKKFNSNAIIAIIIGVMALIIPGLQMIGIVILGCGIGYCVWYKAMCSDEETYLNISLNSGRVYSIICKDKDFLRDVMQVIKYCINNHYNQIVSIDFNDCNITNSPIISGNNNKVSL